MSECLSEEILQCYLDGELSAEAMESAISHLASCSNCADLVSEAEIENNLLASAMAPEFETSVPTESLRDRIDIAIAAMNSRKTSAVQSGSLSSAGSWPGSFSNLFTFTPQRGYAYAGLAAVVIVAFLFAAVHYRNLKTTEAPLIAISKPAEGAAPNTSINKEPPSTATSTVVVTQRAPIVPTAIRRRNNQTRETSPRGDATFANHVRLLPGERTYLQTIADLDSTIRQDKGRMKPAIQAEYERNLAFVDRALAAARTAAKNNPNDPDAAEFMFSAYQSKVDLLNTVADARVYDKQR